MVGLEEGVSEATPAPDEVQEAHRARPASGQFRAAVGPTGAGEQETQGAAHRIGVAESFQAWSRVGGRWPRQRAQEQVSQ